MTSVAAGSNLPPRGTAWVWSLVGGSQRRRLGRASLAAASIRRKSSSLRALSDVQIRERFDELRFRGLCGEPLSRQLPLAYALVNEAARRTVGMEFYDVQLAAGSALADRCVAEMETGEGKTLTATLSLCLWGALGRGAWLVTANDYLARRDAEWMRPVFELLGLSVGILQEKSTPAARRTAYACDITYGTVREFGFDFLRDRLTIRGYGLRRTDLADVDRERAPAPLRERLLQRSPAYVLVDEADSVLIDEARTPLILSAPPTLPPEDVTACFRWAAATSEQLVEDRHFLYDPHWQDVLLTDAGREAVRGTPYDPKMQSLPQPEIFRAVERAVRVRRNFRRDRDYVVRDRKIVLIDENTGRPGEGRQWQEGVHQAIEAREGLPITSETETSAQVTVQELFQLHEHLAGMTGTAMVAAREFRKAYRLVAVAIPTHRPSRRVILPPLVCRTRAEKWDRVLEDVRTQAVTGRPILIGTRSIADSLAVSERLKSAGFEHAVLNANELEREAEIVARAGRRGSIVVATNMAGRGTDIKLEPESAELGGLHVIATELHDSVRVDRQLIGRCGRQGDPGSVQPVYSLEDEVLSTAYGLEPAKRLRERWSAAVSERPQAVLDLLRRAQRTIEARHTRERTRLLRSLEDRRRAQRELGQDPYLDALD